MDWTWHFDEVAIAGLTLGTLAGVIFSLVLSAAVSVWLLCRGASRRWSALPRPLQWLGSPFGRAAAAALMLLSWDGLYLNSGAQNMLVIVLALFLQLVFVAVCAATRRSVPARSHAAAAAVWVLAGLAMAGFSRFNIRLAQERSDAVIGACRRFEGDFGRLPVSLDELVPRYLPYIPLASWTELGSFFYDVEAKPTLTFYSPWPTLRIYEFQTNEWFWNDAPMPFEVSDDEGPATALVTPAGDAPRVAEPIEEKP